jgi:hypothetical protein
MIHKEAILLTLNSLIKFSSKSLLLERERVEKFLG